MADHPSATLEAPGIRVPFALHPTNLEGAFTPAPLPEGFDLRTASAASLLKHGVLFRRPTPSDPPSIKALWNLVADRKWEQIVPVLEPQPGRTHVLRDRRKVADGSYTDSAWAGAVLDGTWVGAIGSWKIPTVSKAPEPQGDEGGWHSSSWVGLDGGSLGSNDVIQAGVEQHVDANGNATYVAWYEWFAPQEAGSPAYINQTNIANMPVQPGQEMTCWVSLNNGVGHLYFGNATTSKYVQLTLAAPPGASANGDTAEWIMEAPDGGEPISALPRFSPVVFTGAAACTADLASLGNADEADIYNIVDASGQTLTSVTLGNTEVTIDFIG